jgi:uncharacterized membrane-anchored protein YhcB (DUF1043 family)
MRLLLGIAIGVLIAGFYFNPAETKQKIGDMADWVKAQVSKDEYSVTVPKITVDIQK